MAADDDVPGTSVRSSYTDMAIHRAVRRSDSRNRAILLVEADSVFMTG